MYVERVKLGDVFYTPDTTRQLQCTRVVVQNLIYAYYEKFESICFISFMSSDLERLYNPGLMYHPRYHQESNALTECIWGRYLQINIVTNIKYPCKCCNPGFNKPLGLTIIHTLLTPSTHFCVTAPVSCIILKKSSPTCMSAL